VKAVAIFAPFRLTDRRWDAQKKRAVVRLGGTSSLAPALPLLPRKSTGKGPFERAESLGGERASNHISGIDLAVY
jgi:hypothetical protein